MERTRYRPEWLDFRLLAKPYLGVLDFRGRSHRTEIFSYYFVFTLAGVALLLLALGAETTGYRTDLYSAHSVATFIVQALLTLPLVALMFRRLQDIGWNGWLSLPATLGALGLGLWQTMHHAPFAEGAQYPAWSEYVRVPMVLCLLAIALIPGTQGTNRYGPDPRL